MWVVTGIRVVCSNNYTASATDASRQLSVVVSRLHHSEIRVKLNRRFGNCGRELTAEILPVVDEIRYSASSSSWNVARIGSGRGGRGAVSCRSIFSGFRVFW